MPQIAVSAGAGTEVFDVLVHHGILPNGDMYVCDTVCSRGVLLYFKSAGVASPCPADIGATGGPASNLTKYLGFVEQDVVAADANRIQLQFGYQAVQSVDLVAIWRFGRFRVVAVSGSVAAGAAVYPATGGALSATQTNSSPRVGTCVVGNTTSGGPIVVEINLIS